MPGSSRKQTVVKGIVTAMGSNMGPRPRDSPARDEGRAQPRSDCGARLAAVYDQVAEGHGVMAANVWRELRPILERMAEDHSEVASRP